MGTSCAQCCIVGAEWNLLVSELLVPGTFGRLRKSCYNNMSNALHSLVWFHRFQYVEVAGSVVQQDLSQVTAPCSYKIHFDIGLCFCTDSCFR